MEKKRVIVDYNTLPDSVLEIMANKYPDGYDNDIIKFPNAKGELISAVRVETDEIIYLVKVSKQLEQMVEDFEIDDEDDDDDHDDMIGQVIKGTIIPKEILDESGDDEEEDQYDTADEDEEDEED